jgi:hypothetical protein
MGTAGREHRIILIFIKFKFYNGNNSISHIFSIFRLGAAKKQGLQLPNYPFYELHCHVYARFPTGFWTGDRIY